MLQETHIKNLELVRDICTSIKTIELLVLPDCTNYALSDSPIAAEALDLIDNYLKNIPSIKDVIINFEAYNEQSPSDDLVKKFHRYRWSVKITKLSPQTSESLQMVGFNLTMKKTAKHMTIVSPSSTSGRGRGRKISSGWKNITGADAIPIR